MPRHGALVAPDQYLVSDKHSDSSGYGSRSSGCPRYMNYSRLFISDGGKVFVHSPVLASVLAGPALASVTGHSDKPLRRPNTIFNSAALLGPSMEGRPASKGASPPPSSTLCWTKRRPGRRQTTGLIGHTGGDPCGPVLYSWDRYTVSAPGRVVKPRSLQTIAPRTVVPGHGCQGQI